MWYRQLSETFLGSVPPSSPLPQLELVLLLLCDLVIYRKMFTLKMEAVCHSGGALSFIPLDSLLFPHVVR